MAITFHVQQPQVLTFTIGGRSSGGTPYPGPYTVTPQVDNAVVLPTIAKVMTDNVTVSKIPQYEVSNPAGGKTLTIGEIVL